MVDRGKEQGKMTGIERIVENMVLDRAGVLETQFVLEAIVERSEQPELSQVQMHDLILPEALQGFLLMYLSVLNVGVDDGSCRIELRDHGRNRFYSFNVDDPMMPVVPISIEPIFIAGPTLLRTSMKFKTPASYGLNPETGRYFDRRNFLILLHGYKFFRRDA